MGGGEKLHVLKFDIRKFYENVDHDILKTKIRRKFKDKDFLWVLDSIIDSHSPGLPLGSYTSQNFGNLYLNDFDHWVKETLQVNHYFRYMDDIVIVHESKEELWKLFGLMKEYLETNLKLKVKKNYRVFPASKGIDFVGYVHYPTHTLLRKSIKLKIKRMLVHNPNYKSIASYWGWVSKCNGLNLWKNVTNGKYNGGRNPLDNNVF